MTFDEAIVAAAPAFLATFGETITFQPSVLDRSITAIVTYIDDAAATDPVPRHRSPEANIKVRNDTTLGIATSEFVTNLKINMPARKGGTSRNWHLTKILHQDAAWVTYGAV
jgi:hypothetical protein